MDIVRFLPDLSVYIYMQIVIFSWSPHILLSPVCICRCFKLFFFSQCAYYSQNMIFNIFCFVYYLYFFSGGFFCPIATHFFFFYYY